MDADIGSDDNCVGGCEMVYFPAQRLCCCGGRVQCKVMRGAEERNDSGPYSFGSFLTR